MHSQCAPLRSGSAARRATSSEWTIARCHSTCAARNRVRTNVGTVQARRRSTEAAPSQRAATRAGAVRLPVAVLGNRENIMPERMKLRPAIQYHTTNGELLMIELVVTVCALALPSQCEDEHLSFSADMSLNQCVMNAQPYIAQWINEHPKWVAVRWRCDYGGAK